jgi:hypothetical protein
MFHKIKKIQFLFSVLKDIESAHNRFLKTLQHRVTCSELQKMELKETDVELQPKTDETWSTQVIILSTVALFFVVLSVILAVAFTATFCYRGKTDSNYEMDNIEGGEIPQQQVAQQDESWD